MKKFLSIFIAVAMLMSFAGVFAGAPTAMAATDDFDTVTLSDAKSYLEWYGETMPSFGGEGDYNILPALTVAPTQYIYNMGETISGSISDTAAIPVTVTALTWKVELLDTASVVIDTVNMAAGGTSFTIGTGNVSKDGKYTVRVSGDDILGNIDTAVYIKYNIALSNDDVAVSDCTVFPVSKTISGWITRGSGQTVLVPVDVYVSYPTDPLTGDPLDGGELAGYYTVAASSSGQFSITFPITATTPTGDFHIYVRDGYDPANTENDAMIYKTLNNTPAKKTVTLSTYVSPSILYKELAAQPFLIVATDGNGDYATGLASAFSVKYNDGGALAGGLPPTEISPGFYKFVLSTVGSLARGDVRFSTAATADYLASSNTVIVGLRDLGVFNPYVDVDAHYAIPTYGVGPYTVCELARDVYDLLPCTIGNSLEIVVGVHWTAAALDFALHSSVASVDGPVVNILGTDRYLIKKAGKITASISITVWERIDQNCPIASTNACCYEFSKTFNICETASCTVDKISLENSNLVLSINSLSAPADLQCGCNSKVVHIYMTSSCGLVSNAFTMNTYSGTPKIVSDIWWNPLGTTEAPSTLIPDLPITFGATDTELKIFDDCSTLTFEGFTSNFVNTETCDYNIVIQVFGMQRNYDACGTLNITFPMIYEGVNDISVGPVVTSLSATAIVTEGEIDPDEILAGVLPTIDITDPGFTLATPVWAYYLDGVPVSGITASTTDTGYRFTFSCPLSKAGTFKIYGYACDTECATKEEVTIEIPVIMPEFTVQIGLSDGSVIDNDGIITEGLAEYIYVTATDPRGIHDFATDTNWTLDAVATVNDCDFPTSVVCDAVPSGCTQPSPIAVTGFGNPHIADDPTFELYFVVNTCANLLVDTFTLVPGTAAVDPAEVPFTIPPTATHVTLSVKDAHGHGVPNVSATALSAAVVGSGYTSAAAAVTNNDGEMDWAFVPMNSGKYSVSLTFAGGLCVTLPCGWGIGAAYTAPYVPTSGNMEIIAVYEAPVLDTEAPVVTAAAGEIVEGAVTISGTVEDNVGVVSLYIGAMKVDFAPDGAFSAVVELAEGENVIKVVAFDAAGNKGEVELTVDYAVPTVTVVKVQIGSDIMTVNGQIKQLDAVAEINEGRTYLPLRAIAEALGAEVTWIAETKGITLILNDHTVGLQIGNVSAVVDGNVIAIFPPYLKPYGDGTFAATMVPARLISEGLGAEVTWDPALRIVTITLVQP